MRGVGKICDFWLQRTFQQRIAPQSLEIDRDSLRTKLSALNVVFTNLHFAPFVQGILHTGASNLGTPSKMLVFGSSYGSSHARR